MLSLFAFVLPSIAQESIPQSVLVTDQVGLFDQVEIDSGWLPDSGNMAVRVQIAANGTADVALPGEAVLRWPEDLELSFRGEEDSGKIALDAQLDTTVSIRFDISGYSWESEIATRSIEFAGEQTVDPFLVGEEQSVETVESGNQVIDYNTTVLAVVDVSFAGELRPSCTMTFEGKQWDIDGTMITSEDAVAQFAPSTGAASFDRSAVYSADITTHCELDFVPVFEVCVPIVGCYDWEPTEVDIDDLDSAISHNFPANSLSFPLPALQSTDSIDFGTVDVDSLSNQELIIDNIGTMLLEGTATLNDESGAFSVFSPNLYIPSEGTDSIVFSFIGEEKGEYSATVEIASNDPAQPSKIITLSANVANGAKGCSATGRQQYPYSLLFLVPLVGLLRRRS